MTPEDVLLEAMAAVLSHGNDLGLRPKMCRKLRESIDREREATSVLETG